MYAGTVLFISREICFISREIGLKNRCMLFTSEATFGSVLVMMLLNQLAHIRQLLSKRI